MEITASTTTFALAAHEIEEHLVETNDFFKTSHLTLDDLHEYGNPLGHLASAVYRASEGFITKQQAIEQTLIAIDQLQAIHQAMNAANAA